MDGLFVLLNSLSCYIMHLMQEYTNILVIKLGALGDFIHMTGWYAAIRHRWPKAKLTLMTGTPFLKLAQKSGYFDDYRHFSYRQCTIFGSGKADIRTRVGTYMHVVLFRY